MTEVAKDISAKLKALAKKADAAITAISEALNKRGPALGLWIEKINKDSLWHILGFESENDYRDFKRIGRSTWFEWKRLRNGLSRLPVRDFLRLTAANAAQLVRLSEKQRYDKKWINLAIEKSESEFTALVDKAVDDGDGDPQRDPGTWFKVRMTKSQAKMVDECLDEFAEQHEELEKDNRGMLLEFLCLEWRQEHQK
jgi:hypothetical protein